MSLGQSNLPLILKNVVNNKYNVVYIHLFLKTLLHFGGKVTGMYVWPWCLQRCLLWCLCTVAFQLEPTTCCHVTRKWNYVLQCKASSLLSMLYKLTTNYDITTVLIMIIMGINVSAQVAYTDESIHLYMPNYSIAAMR